MNKPTLICYGGVGAVTGANFMLEVGGKQYVVDCGLLQGVPGADETNAAIFEYDPRSITAVFITHAHADHIGKLPKLVREGFTGDIYSTKETFELSRLMLEDTAKITERNAKETGQAPLYDLNDVSKTLSMWKAINYHDMRDFDGFSVESLDAGHILGSAMYKFIFPSGKSMVFTGDLGNSPSPLLKDTEKVIGVDYMLMESVYGDRNHESVEDRDSTFRRVIEETAKRNGTLIIPIFSLERTQVILYELSKMFDAHALPKIPVFLDSPLAIRVTDVYEKVSSIYNDEVKAELRKDGRIFSFNGLEKTAEVRDSKEIEHVHGPKIILAGSGMSTAGRILHHEIRYLPDPNATILFVGYQAPRTLGRQIVEGAKKVVIDGEEIEVRAHVESVEGFSGHKDSDHLVEFVADSAKTLKQVFVAMGETKSEIFLAQRLRDELGVKAVVPERGKRYELDL